MPQLSIDVATISDNLLVAAPAATKQRIRVLHYVLVAAGAVTVQWKSGSTTLSGAMSLITGVPLSLPFAPHSEGVRKALLVCNAGEALNLTLGGNVQVSGHLEYDIID